MPVPVVPPRVRVEIVGGRLLRLNPPVSESMVPWGPKAGAWRNTQAAGWREYEPEIRVAELEADTESAAARFLVSRWPERVRRAVRGFSHGQWRLILHANYCGPHYEELLESHPAMGWLVAYRERFRPGEREFATWAAARRLTGLRRRTIVGEMGFPDTERTVRLLARVPAALLSVETMRMLRSALHSAGAERLWRLPRLNQTVAAIVANPARLARVTQAFLETAAAWDDGEEMERCLDELDGRDRRRAPAPWSTVFREPPLPETETIRAIRTKEDLAAEGAAMHHCVGGYGWRVLEGDVYFYRMSEPERATICITPRAGWWVLEEVRGVCNQSVRESTLAAIEAWLGAGR